MLKHCLQTLMQKQSLTQTRAQQAMENIMQGADAVQAAAFFALLHAKGETSEELLGIVKAMQAAMIEISCDEEILDIVGTGGDGANTVNLSTAAAILAASCGARVIKHGNRSVSSNCGSADVLEALGIRLAVTSEEVVQSLKCNSIGFCYAPQFHPAFAALKSMRTALGTRTALNLVGPLLNPSHPSYAVIGVSDKKYLPLFADVAQQLPFKRAMIVYGQGLDELSLLGPATVIEVGNGKQKSYTLDPKEYGFQYCHLRALQGGDALTNAELILAAFNAKNEPIANSIVLNAGVALYISNQTETIATGINLARAKLQSGDALKFLQHWIKRSQTSQYLQAIIANKQREVTQLREQHSRCSLKKSLSNKRGGVIAEIKRKSPSKSHLATIDDPVTLAKQYIDGGASAISVLTDSYGFNGSLQDLMQVAEVAHQHHIPVLRKDFILDPIQIAESIKAGADAILLIVSVLKDKTKIMLDYARAMGIDALVEVHDQQELELAVACGADIIGINNRHLQTFVVDVNQALRLYPHIPHNIITVAESGIATTEMAQKFSQCGFNGLLIGEALVTSKNPAAFIQSVTIESPKRESTAILIKICGITSSETAIRAAALGAQYIGLIQAPNSPRHVDRQTTIALSKAIQKAKAVPVAVFTDFTAEQMLEVCKAANIDCVQLHGDLARRSHAQLPKNIQRIFVLPVLENGKLSADYVDEINSLDPQRDFLLFDTMEPGTGKNFCLQNFYNPYPLRFFIAGGLQPQNVAAVISQCQPQGVDVSSGVEASLGVKDLKLIEEFIYNINLQKNI